MSRLFYFSVILSKAKDLVFFKAGFRPRNDESLLFRQKGPKPFLPVRVPAGKRPLHPESRWLKNSRSLS
jgi:hypothetical protein